METMVITINDIKPGFKFTHAGVTVTVQHISEKQDFVRFSHDDGSGCGTISAGTLLRMLNR